MISDVRAISLAVLRCKSRLEGHRWVITQPPSWLFARARKTGGLLITDRCDNCHGWRYRHMNRRTGDWLDNWKYAHDKSYKTYGLEPRDFRREYARRLNGKS